MTKLHIWSLKLLNLGRNRIFRKIVAESAIFGLKWADFDGFLVPEGARVNRSLANELKHFCNKV
ncbi:hypothetical protein E9993_22760 [Labilibacter sediminis]|nr:hypothetical protein E9993_22760 [Labilibacter sediminis]